MAKKSISDKYNKKHLEEQFKRVKIVANAFDEMVKNATKIAAKSGFNNPDDAFYFKDYPKINKEIDELMSKFSAQVQEIIETGSKDEWMAANAKNDALVDSLVASTTIPKETIEKWKQQNLNALKTFQQRKVNGMNLSERVWNLTGQTKEELELALDIGLGEGKSAADLTRSIKKFLQNPDKLFRRVRDKHGNLRLSQAAKAYHPGRGVYRSSYKNALRLTATENNIAYRTADYQRWQQMDFVVGTEIKLSNNHNCVGIPKGKFDDICDELAGVYPKDFKFTGWHPFCRCFAVPKLGASDNDDENFEAFLERLTAEANGEKVSDVPGVVTDLPDNFKKWLKDNEEKTAKAKSLPYFLKDNQGLINNSIHTVQSPKETTAYNNRSEFR